MKKKIPTDGSSSSSINTAFAELKIDGLPQVELVAPPTSCPRCGSSSSSRSDEEQKHPAEQGGKVCGAPRFGTIATSWRKLGKITLAIEKSGRSGKTVTVLKGSGIEKLTAEHREELLTSLKRKFACGGTIEGNTLELQGDERPRLKIFLQSLGFSA